MAMTGEVLVVTAGVVKREKEVLLRLFCRFRLMKYGGEIGSI